MIARAGGRGAGQGRHRHRAAAPATCRSSPAMSARACSTPARSATSSPRPRAEQMAERHARSQRRRRRAAALRQLWRRRDELRHGRRDAGDGGHRLDDRAPGRRRRLRAAGRGAAEAARRRRHGLSPSRSPGAAAEARGDLARGHAPPRRRRPTPAARSASALSPCIVPQAGKPTFEIGDDEMEMGMGIHGEPGIWRDKLRPADAIADEMLDRLLADQPVGKGDRVSRAGQHARRDAAGGALHPLPPR